MNRRILLYMWFLVWVAMALALTWEVSAGSCQIDHAHARKELIRKLLSGQSRMAYDIFHIPYSHAFIKKILSDSRLCPTRVTETYITWDELKENVLAEKSIARGIQYIREHKEAFAIARDTYGVEPSVLAAIIRVETNFGNQYHLGQPILLNRLYRRYFLVFNAGRYFTSEKFFLHQIAWTLVLAEQHSWNVFDAHWKSSRSGAFGIPQFIPESFWRYATDGDGDTIIDLFNHEDAIVSTANYLSRRGKWRQQDEATHRRAVESYNPGSDRYPGLVLEYRNRLRKSFQ